MTVPARFGVLRLIATLLKTLAWIALVLSILSALAVAVIGPLVRQSLLAERGLPLFILADDVSGLLLAAMLVFSGALSFLMLFGSGEAIQIRLAIEENTRLTAALLLRMDRENLLSGEDERQATYYGEVVDR